MKVLIDQKEINEIKENWSLAGINIQEKWYVNGKVFFLADYYKELTRSAYGDYNGKYYLIDKKEKLQNNDLKGWQIVV